MQNPVNKIGILILQSVLEWQDLEKGRSWISLLLYSSCWQLSERSFPWDIHTHAYFTPDYGEVNIVKGYRLQSIVCVILKGGLVGPSPPILLNYKMRHMPQIFSLLKSSAWEGHNKLKIFELIHKRMRIAKIKYTRTFIVLRKLANFCLTNWKRLIVKHAIFQTLFELNAVWFFQECAEECWQRDGQTLPNVLCLCYPLVNKEDSLVPWSTLLMKFDKCKHSIRKG